jgi:hypothetical protein
MSMSEEEYRQQAEALWHEHDELQRLIEERCRKAEADWLARHPWLAPDICVTCPGAAIRHLLKRSARDQGL